MMKVKVSWMIFYAIVLHITWGLIIIFYPEPLDTTPLYSLKNHFLENQVMSGYLLLLAGIMAAVGMLPRFSKNLTGLILLLPQQYLMIVSALGAVACIMNSAYADGVIRPRAFIFADQYPAILATIVHTFALIDYHTESLWKYLGLRLSR